VKYAYDGQETIDLTKQIFIENLELRKFAHG